MRIASSTSDRHRHLLGFHDPPSKIEPRDGSTVRLRWRKIQAGESIRSTRCSKSGCEIQVPRTFADPEINGHVDRNMIAFTAEHSDVNVLGSKELTVFFPRSRSARLLVEKHSMRR